MTRITFARVTPFLSIKMSAHFYLVCSLCNVYLYSDKKVLSRSCVIPNVPNALFICDEPLDVG